MAFNTLEYLRDGKVDFVFQCTPYDYEHLIENVRKAHGRFSFIILAVDTALCVFGKGSDSAVR